MSGFLSKCTSKTPGKKITSKNIRYRLADNYLRFYLKYIEPAKPQIEQRLYRFVDLDSLPGWNTIMGFQFENLVLNNIESVCEAIGVSMSTIQSAGPYFQNQTKDRPGCQIDILIETRYTIYVCEVKFQRKIAKSVISETAKKIQNLVFPKRFTIRPILIYVGELDSQIENLDFFAKIVSFEQLLVLR